MESWLQIPGQSCRIANRKQMCMISPNNIIFPLVPNTRNKLCENILNASNTAFRYLQQVTSEKTRPFDISNIVRLCVSVFVLSFRCYSIRVHSLHVPVDQPHFQYVVYFQYKVHVANCFRVKIYVLYHVYVARRTGPIINTSNLVHNHR